MLLLQAPIKVIIDVVRTIAFILLIHYVLLNDCNLFEPFNPLNKALSHLIGFPLFVGYQLRFEKLLCRPDVKLKTESHCWQGTLASDGLSWGRWLVLVWWIAFRNSFLTFNSFYKSPSRDSLMSEVFAFYTSILIEFLSSNNLVKYFRILNKRLEKSFFIATSCLLGAWKCIVKRRLGNHVDARGESWLLGLLKIVLIQNIFVREVRCWGCSIMQT